MLSRFNVSNLHEYPSQLGYCYAKSTSQNLFSRKCVCDVTLDNLIPKWTWYYYRVLYASLRVNTQSLFFDNSELYS